MLVDKGQEDPFPFQRIYSYNKPEQTSTNNVLRMEVNMILI